jgi:hypothetical protein
MGAAAAPVPILAAAHAWQQLPALSSILDGKELLPAADQAKANIVRNLFELTSFIATTALLLTALWAFAFTKSQIKEARDTRLAGLYATLEARWASPEMQESKTIFAEITDGYGKVAHARKLAGRPPPSLPDFADGFVEDLRRSLRPLFRVNRLAGIP